MLGLIKTAAAATVILGTALTNCGNPPGAPHITAVAVSCKSYHFDFDGFPADANVNIHQQVIKRVGSVDLLLDEHNDGTLLESSGTISHANGLNETSTWVGYVQFTWNIDGAKTQTYVSNQIECNT